MLHSEPTYIFLFEGETYDKSDSLSYNVIQEIVDTKRFPSSVLKETSRGLSFSFVGIILLKDRVVCFLPKYLKDYAPTSLGMLYNSLEDSWEWKHLIRVLNSLRTYVKQNQLSWSNAEEDRSHLEIDYSSEYFNEFAIAEFIIENYLSYGIWIKKSVYADRNSSKATDWNRTIEWSHPIFSRGNLYYTEYYSRSLRSQFHIVSEIHKYAVNRYINGPLCKLLGYGDLYYEGDSYRSLEQIGDSQYLIDTLERELRLVYVEEEIVLLRTLIEMIKRKTSPAGTLFDFVFGTSSFHNVWELACKVALKDISKQLEDENIFPTPTWKARKFVGKGGATKEDLFNKKNRLIPDVVHCDLERTKLLVADAKYYLLSFDQIGKKVFDNPGISDITKQILYQQVLQSHTGIGYDETVNAFVFPYSPRYRSIMPNDDSPIWGHIESNIPGWEHLSIIVLFMQPNEILDCFISSKPLNNFNSFLNNMFIYKSSAILYPAPRLS